ncbi:unnamed protein product [Dracunculus medinensis]|uniref:NRF domain-containing protein n=1 Tax=Dracunculus medinensis TaxID=318479 RepID=A0A0N4UKT1_DRAME|nr:unnamed protein product [Dracunculus medinensis]
MAIFRQTILNFYIIAIALCNSSLIGLLELPPRPRSIDNFQLPSPEKLNFPDSSAELCALSKTLRVSAECRNGVSKIFCSLADLIEAQSSSCDSSNGFETCEKCYLNAEKLIKDNFWSVKYPQEIVFFEEIVFRFFRSGIFDGKYCRIQLKIPDSETRNKTCRQTNFMQIHLGICVPYQCSTDEIEFLSHLIFPYSLNVRCESPLQWSLLSQIFLSVIVIWILILISGTLIDISDGYFQKNGLLLGIAECLSVVRNGSDALSIKRQCNFHAIQGIQVISTIVIITANSYYYMMPFIENIFFSYENVHSSLFHPLNNFSYHIDAIIALNALYSSIALIKIIRTTDDIKLSYCKRLSQVLPLLFFVIAFMTLIFEKLSSGPLWIHGEMIKRCNKSWWKNILFINNLFTVTQTCIDHGYLFALEAQFFIALGPLVYLALRYLKMVIICSVLALFGFIFYIFYISYNLALPPTLMLTEPLITSNVYELYLDTLYIRPWTRAPAFIIGFLFSFLLIKRIKSSRLISSILWSLIFLVCVWVIFFLYWHPLEYPSVALSIYSAIHRSLWSLAICLIIYLCSNDFGGQLATFLEWRLFVPLAKLIYPVILISEPVLLYLFTSLDRPLHATHWSTLYIALGTIILSYMISFAIDIVISRPIYKVIAFFIPQFRSKTIESVVAAESKI